MTHFFLDHNRGELFDAQVSQAVAEPARLRLVPAERGQQAADSRPEGATTPHNVSIVRLVAIAIRRRMD